MKHRSSFYNPSKGYKTIKDFFKANYNEILFLIRTLENSSIVLLLRKEFNLSYLKKNGFIGDFAREFSTLARE